jgi:hypothetical protein
MFFVAIAAIPLLAAWIEISPVLLLGVFVAAQPLEAFELQTPLGTLSLGIFVLAALVLRFRLGAFAERARRSPELRLAAALLLLWVGVTFVSIARYDGVGAGVRHLITTLSFLAVALVASSMPIGQRTVSSVAIGATLALGALAVIGVLASVGIVPHPTRFTPPRSFFGLVSPFRRNYGLNVQYDATALLVPLAAPLAAVYVVRADLCRRFRGVLILAVITFGALFVFQARGMLLAIFVALTLALVVCRRASPFAVLPLVAVVLIVFAPKVAAIDQTSTNIRTTSDLTVLRTAIEHPSHYAFGTNEDELALQAQKYQAALAGLSTKQTQIHDFFLSNLVSSGYAGLLSIAAVFMLALRAGVRNWRASVHDPTAQALLIAMATMTISCLLEPISADIVGCWLILGLILASAVGREDFDVVPVRRNFYPAKESVT